MAKQTINIGSSANDGTGDPLRTAFDKINDNFTELYGATAEANDIGEDTSPQLGGNLDLNGHSITTARSNENININPAGTGTIELVANTNVTGDLAITGNTTVSGRIFLGDGATDVTQVTGVFEADNLTIDGTTITSKVTNGDVTIQGNGTGVVAIPNLKVDGNISVTDNEIQTTVSNSDLNILKIINKNSTHLKILGSGEIKDKVNIEANNASKAAIEKLEKIGGSIQLKK